MGGGPAAAGSRELDQTPTWAVSAVCATIVMISIGLEKVIHYFEHVFHMKKRKYMLEALEKLKAELMVLGFISLLLTFGQNYITRICITHHAADTMLPCPLRSHYHKPSHGAAKGGGEAAEHHRRLLWRPSRFLATDSAGPGCKEGYISMISINGLHQLHIFIFFLAVFHVFYGAVTMTLGKLKIRTWKTWENEVKDHESDPSRYRLTRDTSFVRDHIYYGTKSPLLFYFVCFIRQFVRTVHKADYLTMRHGFVTVHLTPGSKFDFQKYILRSLEDDFKHVVGISPLLWASAVTFLLLNVSEWDAMAWLSVVPVIVILSVGTKLQAIVANMALEIQERHAVVQGIPLVSVSDKNFWFSWPQLILYLIHFVLFQNAFEITYFFWIWYEFGLKSCFHEHFSLALLRIVFGVAIQTLCSYSTLPLYALVTQMGSTMKQSIFDEQTSKALKQWHKKAQQRKHDDKPGEMEVKKLGVSHDDSPSAANITASVDINGDHHGHDHDLLTGP